jgi:hypothetical protein
MTIQDAVETGNRMYLGWYGDFAGPELSGYIADACEMVRNNHGPHWDSGNELRSTQVIAGIVVAYRMTKSRETK